MPEENNSNISQNVATTQVEAGPSQPPVSQQPQLDSQKSNRKFPKTVVLVMTLMLLIAGSATAGYFYGKSKNKSETSKSAVATPKPIDLPPEAIKGKCIDGRGQQYVIPKDSTAGPFYDVNKGKVIAIEYTIGVKSLLTDSDNFSDTILLLTKTYPVDHFSIVTVTPKAGDTDQYIHLIMFVVSKDEAKSITCEDSSSNSQSSSTSSSTSTSNSQTSNSSNSSQSTTQ